MNQHNLTKWYMHNCYECEIREMEYIYYSTFNVQPIWISVGGEICGNNTCLFLMFLVWLFSYSLIPFRDFFTSIFVLSPKHDWHDVYNIFEHGGLCLDMERVSIPSTWNFHKMLDILNDTEIWSLYCSTDVEMGDSVVY